MGLTRITTSGELAEALARPTFLLVKHSPTCPVSARGFYEVQRTLAGRPELETGWLHVVEERPLSRWVESQTGIVHQSPQALLFVAGECLWHASHGGITRDRLEEILLPQLGKPHAPLPPR